MMSGLGLLVETKNDAELDVLTLISGCGPGVVAYLVDALAENARRLGIQEAGGEQVAFQTFKGTLAYMEENKIAAKRLADSVATKGGVTEMILETLTKKGLKKNLATALSEGHRRIKKVSK
jgi:pyrroline-5-carboxylate reductase